MSRSTKEQPAVKRTKAAKPVAETKRTRQAKPSSGESKANEVKAERAVKLTPKQKNEVLKLKLQQLLEEI